jgi:hypothetical protein
MTPAGLPHSETPGSTPACGSPRLFAAYRVLHRRSVPRHPPCALSSLGRSSRQSFPTRTGPPLPAHTDPAPTHTHTLSTAQPFTPNGAYPRRNPPPGIRTPRPSTSSCQTGAAPRPTGRAAPASPNPDPAGEEDEAPPPQPRRTVDSSRPFGPPPPRGGAYSARSRKEVIQPQVPLRLPCYDFAPVIELAFGRCLPASRVGPRTSGAPDSHGVTGGVYKARERIHRGVADPRLLAIPASCSRVADCNPNLDRVFPIRSASRPRSGLSRPL